MGEQLRATVDDGVIDLLIELAGSSRKQGEYLSKMIQAAHDNAGAMGSEKMEVEGLRLQVLGLAGQQKAVEGRLLQVERQLAAIMVYVSDIKD